MLDIYCDFEDGDSIRTQPGDGGGTSQGKRPGDDVGYTHSLLGHNIQDKAEFKMSFRSLVD